MLAFGLVSSNLGDTQMCTVFIVPTFFNLDLIAHSPEKWITNYIGQPKVLQVNDTKNHGYKQKHMSGGPMLPTFMDVNL